ncbi:MAG TPA: hypothetical protein VIY47_13885 [Ignavibacteriaceae bacterium]
MLQNILAVDFKSKKIGYLITDILIVAFIYLLPTLSHITSIPFYLFEPMRIALVFCIIATNQKNSLLIALTLPIVPLILSSHPSFAKSILIMGELAINVIVFYQLQKKFNNKFIGMLFSILIAKVFYYGSKLFFINFGLLQGDLISTPIWIQFFIMIFLSISAAIALKSKSKS